jgi:ribonuclease P protein component
MLPSVLRLQRRPQFLKVAGTRQKWVAPGLILQIRRRPEGDREDVPEGAIRLGFTVSKKVGNAVQRNRARRRLRAAASEVFAQHAALNCDFVVIGRGATLKRSFTSLVSDMGASLKGLKAWRET